MGGSQYGRRERHCGTLGVYVHCGVDFTADSLQMFKDDIYVYSPPRLFPSWDINFMNETLHTIYHTHASMLLEYIQYTTACHVVDG